MDVTFSELFQIELESLGGVKSALDDRTEVTAIRAKPNYVLLAARVRQTLTNASDDIEEIVRQVEQR